MKTVNIICMEWRRKMETTHWNHVTNSGAESCSPLPLNSDLLTNTFYKGGKKNLRDFRKNK